jgi:Fe-S cluster biogenesis protein NfuA
MDAHAREQVARVEALLEAVEGDEPALEAVAAVVELYGEGLRRLVADGIPPGALDDELVSHLLLLHDLHPFGVEERVRQGLDEVTPYLRSHGGDVELLDVDEDGVVRLRLLGHCDGCAGSTATLRSAVEGAIEAAAPEVVRIEVAEPTAPAHPAPLIPVDALTVRTRE